MSKKTKIVYIYLALFAFTLGFSFTLASHTQASGGQCCIVSMCPPPHQFDVQQQGHWAPTDGPGGDTCIQTGGNPCDWTYQCGPEG